MSEYRNVTTDQAVFGAVIAQVRESQHMQKQTLAEEMGVTPSAWSRVEKGESSLNVIDFRRLTEILNYSSDKILDLSREAEVKLRAKGIDVQSTNFVKQAAKSETTNSLSGSTIKGLTSSGMLPVFGTVLFGIVGGVVGSGILAYNMLKRENVQKEE